MDFRKKIDIPKSELRISHKSGLMLFGSCFSENIGKQLLDSKFSVEVNPFGVLYNPASIHQALEILLTEKDFGEDTVFQHQGVYHTFFHHSLFSDTSKEQLLENINRSRKQATQKLKETDVLLITFGTSYVFRHKNSDQIVANCHKLPSSDFDHYRLSVDNIVEQWSTLISELRKYNPAIKILFTVSPIRHWKDGAHNNQLSKAVLLLAIEQLAHTFSGIYYFPSYEIILDELRDYRFYAEDMIHPNEVAIKYIWEIFSNTFFDSETMQINTQWQNISKAISHRPFNPNSKHHKEFLRQTLLKIRELQDKYPYFDCEKEITLLANQISPYI